MLVARGERSIGSARMLWAVLFAPRVWSVVVERSGLTLDTRFVPPARGAPRARCCVYLLLGGAWTIHEGERLVAPCAFVVSEEQLEGADGRRPYTFAAGGEPFQAIEIHLDETDVRVAPRARPAVVRADASVFAAAAEVVASVRRDDVALERTFAALLAGLAVIDPELAALRPSPRPVARIWAAVRPMVERLYLNPTLQELETASGLSTRQIDRYVGQFVDAFGLVGTRWRSSVLHLRLKLAVLLLSAEDASVAEVARIVGYGSTDAMARSFRDAGLPPPGAVHEALVTRGTCRGPT